MKDLTLLSEVIERGVPKPPNKRQPVGIDWGAIEDGDSIVAHNASRAAVLISSFRFYKKHNTKYHSFSVSQRKNSDGSMRLFFEDTEATLREKLLKRGLISPKNSP